MKTTSFSFLKGMVGLLMLALVVSCSSSSLFDKTAKAYEDATEKLSSARNNDDCDKIHDELLKALYDITLEYPDWKEIIESANPESSEMKKVQAAYQAWNDKLSATTKDGYYMFMTYCTFDVAVEKYGGKSSSSDSDEKEASSEDSDNDEEKASEVAETDEAEADNVSSDSQDWDELLTTYEEYVDEYISFAKKAANGDMGALSKYSSLMEKAQELSEKLSRAENEMSASQWSRYTKITVKLTKALEQMQ